MVWKKTNMDPPPAEEAITRGDMTKMDIVCGVVTGPEIPLLDRFVLWLFKLKKMKIRNGHNFHEKKYFIQVTDRDTLKSMRVYMDESSLKGFLFHMSKTIDFTRYDPPVEPSNNQDSNQSTPHSHKENNQDNPPTSHT